MERLLKIYVYEDGDPPLFHYSRSQGILGIEGILMHQLEISKFRTRDPQKAHLYFIPLSVQSIANFAYTIHNRAWTPLQDIARDYIQLISTKYPYWNRTLGRDHFILGCHDWVSFLVRFRVYVCSVPHLLSVICNFTDSNNLPRSRPPIQELDQSSLQCEHVRRVQALDRRVNAGNLSSPWNNGRIDRWAPSIGPFLSSFLRGRGPRLH